MSNPEHFIWVEKYRPQTIDECILTEEIKSTFREFVKQGNVPNLLLTGTAGVGKTTIAKALARELDMEYIMINGSEEGNIDVLRTRIKTFASTNSLNSQMKLVILDEADYLNAQSTMPALRGFIEQYSDNCRFILTCNFENRIIDPLHSRLVRVSFNIPPDEKPALAKQLLDRIKFILDEEKVQYQAPALVALIKKHFPDFRKIVNELQRYSSSGIIDAGVLVDVEKDSLNALLDTIKDKRWTDMRKWVGEHPDVDLNTITRFIYNSIDAVLDPNSAPATVVTIDDYLRTDTFVADREIHLVSMLTELMGTMEFKNV